MTFIVELASSNAHYFSNTASNDVIMRMTNANSKLHIGSGTRGSSSIASFDPTGTLTVAGRVNATEIAVNGTVVISSNATSLITGGSSQWSNNSNAVFILDSNVGIGITAPSSKFHVVGDSVFSGNMTIPGALNLGGIYIQKRTGSNFNITTTAGQQFISTASGLGLPAGCNLGVGVASPLYTLDVGGDINFSGSLLRNGLPYLGSQFSNSSSNVFLLSSNLGIKTQTPQYPLDVRGDINFTGTLRQNGLPYQGSQFSNTSSNVFLLSSNLGIKTQTPQYPLDVTGDVNFTGTLRRNGLPYIGSQFSNTSSNVFLLNSNLGINKSNPQYPLDVTGDINLTGTFRQNGLPYIGSQFSNSSSNVFLLNSNLGIGVSNPISPLQVAGNILPGSNLTYDLGSSDLRWRDLFLSGNTINLGGTKISADGSNNLEIRDATQNTLKKIVVDQIQIGDVSTGDAIVIAKNPVTKEVKFFSQSTASSNLEVTAVSGWTQNDTGEVYTQCNTGIGTSNPDTLLHVVGDSKFEGNVTFMNTMNIPGLILTPDGSSNANVGYTNSPFKVNLSNAAYVDVFFGVCQSNPAYNLDVTGDINFTGNLTKNGILFSGSPFITNSSNVYVLSSNVGINTTNPQYNLHVAGDVNFTGNLTKNGALYKPSPFTENSSNIYIQNSNVGIGTTAPEAPLHVNGTTIVKKLTILAAS